MNFLNNAPVCSAARRYSRCTPFYACPQFGCSAVGRQSRLHLLTAIPRRSCLPSPWVSLHVHVPICVSTVHAMQIRIHHRLGLLGHLHCGSDVQAYSMCADGKRFMDVAVRHACLEMCMLLLHHCSGLATGKGHVAQIKFCSSCHLHPLCPGPLLQMWSSHQGTRRYLYMRHA